MLDKSIPYKSIMMVLKQDIPLLANAPNLPKGYRFAFYQPGDETIWAQLETSVGEFDNIQAALQYFKKEFLPYPKLLAERMSFVYHESGKPCATATAWFHKGGGPILHWVSTRPEEQKKGLGSAVVHRALSIARHAYPNEDITLHTQTWSHQAIRLYRKFGFELVKSHAEGNDYSAAIAVLKQVYPPDYFAQMVKHAKNI